MVYDGYVKIIDYGTILRAHGLDLGFGRCWSPLLRAGGS